MNDGTSWDLAMWMFCINISAMCFFRTLKNSRIQHASAITAILIETIVNMSLVLGQEGLIQSVHLSKVLLKAEIFSFFFSYFAFESQDNHLYTFFGNICWVRFHHYILIYMYIVFFFHFSCIDPLEWILVGNMYIPFSFFPSPFPALYL